MLEKGTLTHAIKYRILSKSNVFLNSSVSGTGSPVLLCDGLLCDGHIWKYLLPSLESQHKCIHWHYPGHGESEDPSRFCDVTINRLADDAQKVLAKLCNQPAIIIGHSLGVQVALELWHRHPHFVKALVLICGAPGHITRSFYQSQIWQYLVPVIDLSVRFLGKQTSQAWRRIRFDKMLGPIMSSSAVNGRLLKDIDLLEYLSKLNRVDVRVGLSLLKSAGEHDTTPFLSEINVPVLVVAGAKDRFTPPEQSRLIANGIPGAELFMAKSGTHSLPIEQPDLVNLRIKRFIADRVNSDSTS